MIELTPDEYDRFWLKVEKTNNCWVWTGGTRNGYGLFRLRDKMWSAHRLSYAIHKGDVGNFKVRHTCDNPPCINPEHLLLGTHQDNSNDKMIRDRHTFSLTNEQVLDIRSRPLTTTMCRDLAEEFGVDASLIKNVLTGNNYAWLPGARQIPPQFTAHKFSPADLEYIMNELSQAKWGTQTRLAEKFGVTRGTISHINRHRLKYTNTDTQ
jgi:hypothetical protein